MFSKVGRLLLRAAAATLAGLAILIAALAWRLSSGPISLAFLAPYVGEALLPVDGGYSVEVSDTVLAWISHERTLDVRAVDVRLRREDGTVLAAAPEVSVRLSGRELFRGRLIPTEVDLFRVELRLVRDVTGRFDFEQSEPDGGSGNILALLADEMGKPRGDAVSGRLTRASLRQAKITFVDETLGVVWYAPEAELVLWRDGERIRGELDASVALDDRLSRISVAADYEPASSQVGLVIQIREFEPALLASRSPLFADLRALELPVSGTLAFGIDGAGTLSELRFDLAAGAGNIVLPEFPNQPLPVRRISARGTAAGDGRLVRLEHLGFGFADFSGEIDGVIDLNEGGQGVALQGRVDAVATDVLPRYWPETFARNAREWILQNIKGGKLHDIRLRTQVPAAALQSGDLPGRSIQLDFAYEDLSVNYFPPLPRLSGVTGTARMDAERIDLQVTGGGVGELQLGPSSVAVEGLNQEDQDATIEVTVNGPSRAALELLDHPRLGFVKDFGIDPKVVGGSSSTTAKFSFPLRKALTMKEVQVEAVADLSDLEVPGALDRFDVTGGTVRLTVDKQRLRAQGALALNRVPVDLVWQEEFAATSGYASRYEVTGTLDRAAMQAFGIDPGSYMDGTLPTRLIVESGKQAGTRLQGRIELRTAVLQVPELHWRKAAGEAGRMEVEALISTEGTLQVPRFAVTAGGLEASGTAERRADGMQRLSFDRLIYDGNDLQGTVVRQADGGYDIDLHGGSFDLRPFLAEGGAGGGDGPAVRAKVRLARLILSDSGALTEVAGTAERRDGRWQAASAAAHLGATAALQVALAGEGTGRRLTMSATDAGALIAALGFGDHVVGGRLEMAGTYQDHLPSSPLQGRLQIHEFTLVGAPVLARILTIGSLTGIGEILTGEGIGFEKADVPFVLDDATLKIDRARAYGPALGFTAEGNIDREQDVAALNGTIVPAYTLNTVLGYIPLVGKLLTNRPGEGLFGLTFRVTGPVDEPQVTVNPLSALAPGILRRIFEPADRDAGGRGLQSTPDESGSPDIR